MERSTQMDTHVLKYLEAYRLTNYEVLEVEDLEELDQCIHYMMELIANSK